MPRIRIFDRLPPAKRVGLLLACLSYAMREECPRRTDLIGIACNYGLSQGVRRSDFDAIVDKPLREILAVHPLAAKTR